MITFQQLPQEKQDGRKKMPSQKLIGWINKNFVLQGLVVFQGRRHPSGAAIALFSETEFFPMGST
jgi:hypothetical protein